MFGEGSDCIKNYGVLLESCCYSHYRDIETHMGTSGYTFQSIGSRTGHRTERFVGGPRMAKYSTEANEIYQSVNVENFVYADNQKNHHSFNNQVPNLFFGGYRHGWCLHQNHQDTKIIVEMFDKGQP